jgi:hypothetical protein
MSRVRLQGCPRLPQTMEMIWENLEIEVQGLLEDLKMPGLEPLSED